ASVRPAPARRPSGRPGAGALGAAGDGRVLVGLVGVGAVDGRDHGAQGGGRDGTGAADAPEDAVAELHLDVRGRGGVVAGGHRVLRVVEDAHLVVEHLVERGHERRQRAVAAPGDLGVLALPLDHGVDGVLAVIGLRRVELPGDALHGRDAVQVFQREDVPHDLGRDLAALGLGDVLDELGEFHLQAPRQLQAVVALHDVGDAALAGLRVHADDGLVGAALVLGVDGQVRHLPRDVGDVL